MVSYIYIVSAALFILSLKWMNSPATARRGVFAGEIGMLLAIVGTLLGNDPGGLAARSLATFVGSGFTQRISFVRALHGQIILGLRGGLEVLLGPPLDLPLKIGIVRGLLPSFAPVSQGGPSYLDVTVPERPVAGRNPRVSG